MNKKLLLLLMACLALAMFAAACGDDDDDDASDAPAAAQTESADSGATEEETDTAEAEDGNLMTEENLNAFIAAVNEDPSILCDPDNITGDLLEQIGGEEACKEAAAQEEPGGEYEVKDLVIDGNTATATIIDDDGSNSVAFVQEGDEIKVSKSESE